MNILIVGGGGREHAIALAFSKSELVKRIVVAPGNPGIEEFAECKHIPVDDLDGLCILAKEIKADLVFIGPELPLVLGLKNKLDQISIQSFGPSKEASRLEGSKIFAREFCTKYHIPQPKYFKCFNMNDARKAITFFNGKCVVKADGLASGKGVIVCNNMKEALAASESILVNKIFSEAGNKILIEERLFGLEASVFAISNGTKSYLIGTAQDYKRAFDEDKGPNTGGMGAISPAPSLNKISTNKIFKIIIKPTIDGMLKEGTPFEGVLYSGLMMTNEGPKLIEFNCRLGDPETQAIIPRLNYDFFNLISSLLNNKEINEEKILSSNSAITVVLANKGYPGNYKKNLVLPSLKKIKKSKEIKIFHSGTSYDSDKNLIASGGRVLSISSTGKNFDECRHQVYQLINKINWENGFFRKDIGKPN